MRAQDRVLTYCLHTLKIVSNHVAEPARNYYPRESLCPLGQERGTCCLSRTKQKETNPAFTSGVFSCMTETLKTIKFAQRVNKHGNLIEDESGNLIVDAFSQESEVSGLVRLIVIACPSIQVGKNDEPDTVALIENNKRNHYRRKILEAVEVLQSWGLCVQVELYVSNVQPLFHRLAGEFGDVETYLDLICATEEIYQKIGPYLRYLLTNENAFEIATPVEETDETDPSIDSILAQSLERIVNNVLDEAEKGSVDQSQFSITNPSEYHNHLKTVAEPKRIEVPLTVGPKVLDAVMRMQHLISLMAELPIDWNARSHYGEEFLLALYAIDTTRLMETLVEEGQVAAWLSIQKSQTQNDLISAAVEVVNGGVVPYPVALGVIER